MKQLARNVALGFFLAAALPSCGAAPEQGPEVARVDLAPTTVAPPADPLAPPMPGPEPVPGELPQLPPPGTEDPSAPAASGAQPTAVAPGSTPELTVQYAVVFPGGGVGGLPKTPDQVTVALLDRRLTCDEARRVPDDGKSRFNAWVDWKPGQAVSFTRLVMNNGKSVLHKGGFQVIDAPRGAGSIGKIRMLPQDGANVVGGEVSALVCD